MKLKLILILFFSINLISNAQKAPMRYGKINKSDLEMKVYDKDSSASAVILCEFGYYYHTTNKFVRLLRIKILKKEGFRYANVLSKTYASTNVRGITYNLLNGEIAVITS
jgi:hypothetical protein